MSTYEYVINIVRTWTLTLQISQFKDDHTFTTNILDIF